MREQLHQGRSAIQRALRVLIPFLLALLPLSALADEAWLPRFMAEVPASELVPGADAYGAVHADLAVAPVLRAGEVIGWAFVTTDFVGTIGYSGKPIHVLAALDTAAHVIGDSAGKTL